MSSNWSPLGHRWPWQTLLGNFQPKSLLELSPALQQLTTSSLLKPCSLTLWRYILFSLFFLFLLRFFYLWPPSTCWRPQGLLMVLFQCCWTSHSQWFKIRPLCRKFIVCTSNLYFSPEYKSSMLNFLLAPKFNLPKTRLKFLHPEFALFSTLVRYTYTPPFCPQLEDWEEIFFISVSLLTSSCLPNIL